MGLAKLDRVTILQRGMVDSPEETRRILFADDDESVQRLVRRVAQSRGYEVISVTKGAEVLSVARQQRPDLIVLDIEFPDADGRDILRALKSSEETRAIPVVVWSGRKTNPSDGRVSLDLGAEDYVEKNDALLLIRKLKRVLLRHRPR